MARRRSLNRRWSRKSSGGTGILNDDSNIIDQDDDVWWKRLENQTNSIRPSGRISVGECSASTELSPSSTINDSASTNEWWEALQKTSQDLISTKSTNKSKESPKKDVISSPSNSETEDRLRETKKQRVNLRRTRRSAGKNAFSKVLESSETEIESESASPKNSQLTHISDHSSDISPPKKSRQRSKNNSVVSDTSINSDTHEIRKTRAAIFKKPRVRLSRNVFDDVLENDDSIESLSQNTDTSGHENDAGKQINNKSPLTQNDSLNKSNKIVRNSSSESRKNESKEKINDETSQTVLSSPVNEENEQDITLHFDSDSAEIGNEPKNRSRRISKRNSDNSLDNIVNDNDQENSGVSSREQSTKQSYSRSVVLNINTTDDGNSNLNSYLSPGPKITTGHKMQEETSAQHAHESSIKRLRTHESDESETTSITEVLKTGSSDQQNMSKNNDKFSSSDKINYLNNSSISEEILKDGDSDDSKKSDHSDEKLNQNNSNSPRGKKSTEINNENTKPKRVSQRLRTQSRHDMEDDSRKENSPQNYSKSSSEKYIDSSVERKKNSNKTRESPENIPIKKSKTSDNNISNKKPTGKRSIAAEIIMESDSSETETFIKSRTRQRVSTENTDDESKAEDREIFSVNSIVDDSVSNEQEEEILETNNNEELDVSQTTPIAKRQSQRASKDNPKTHEKSLENNSEIEEKLSEPDVENDSDNELSRDPSAYELPDMNRSDSVTLSDSDNESVIDDSRLTKNSNPTVHISPRKNLRSAKKKNETSKITSYLTPKQSAKSSPRTTLIPNESSAQNSSKNPSERKLMKINLSNRHYIRDNISAQNSSHNQPIQHEPLPTEEDIRDFREKLKVAAMKLDQNIRPDKERFEKQLNEAHIKSLKQKKSSTKKIISLQNKNSKVPKVVDRAYIVNDKVYKQPKLPRPKHWATDRLYKYLWKKLEPKYKLETRVRSEKFVIDLAAVVTIVTRRKKYNNYKDEVDALMKKMARLGIIKTRNDFYHFCYDFLPYEFRSKVTPILQPGNKTTIPYDPDTVDVPLLNE
ncbi:hypothetical protein PV325_005767 [Microctonus aethiopoides]|uniref:Uncharacterized protein n=1 Tax=Microctonus aethiopoides TaxID=144406 RepID=A0AA39C5M6_9HYME|nr:hypothetical protein PV325_005767 [Microctonus aethiopoides]KAK0158365.1 hypothetical protein PV328_009377 [Microctonus aethiopoides]